MGYLPTSTWQLPYMILLVWFIKVSASFTPHHLILRTLKITGAVRRHPHEEDFCPRKHDSQKPSIDDFSHPAFPPRTCLTVNIPRGGDGDDASSDPKTISAQMKESAIKGRTLLCLVALLYGTLNVSLRLIYQLPDAPTAAALSTARGWLATAGFVPFLLLGRNSGKTKKAENCDNPTSTSHNVDDATLSASASSFSSFVIAGLELAFWNFLAQGLLNIGLLSTSSARASFLTQTSVVFTPVLSRLFGQYVAPNVWLACGLALAGLTLLSAGGGNETAAWCGISMQSLVQFSAGDWLVLGGALSWSLYLFRLSKVGPSFDEINLQFVKTAILAVFYTSWLIGTTMTWGGTGISAFAAGITNGSSFSWLLNGTAGLVLLYSAMGPGTIADVLQQQGQKEVTASEANVILSMEPVFTALCAWVVLGEITSVQEAVGGGIIVASALLATR